MIEFFVMLIGFAVGSGSIVWLFHSFKRDDELNELRINVDNLTSEGMRLIKENAQMARELGIKTKTVVDLSEYIAKLETQLMEKK